MYKLLKKAAVNDGQKNTNPVIVNTAIALKTSSQVSDYFLCSSCEGLFSAGGEKWVMEHCWQPDNTLPLRTALQNAKPFHVGSNNLVIYEGSKVTGVDVTQIIYFTTSVFWRAAAHQFGPILGIRPTKLALGPYEEELRTFLLGQAQFSKHAFLVVTVSSETTDGANEHALLPSLRKKQSGFMQYGFCVPGIMFQLFVGKSIPSAMMASCIVHSSEHLIFLGPNDGFVYDMGKLISRAQPKGDLT